jgi:hypothetical protein
LMDFGCGLPSKMPESPSSAGTGAQVTRRSSATSARARRCRHPNEVRPGASAVTVNRYPDETPESSPSPSPLASVCLSRLRYPKKKRRCGRWPPHRRLLSAKSHARLIRPRAGHYIADSLFSRVVVPQPVSKHRTSDSR